MNDDPDGWEGASARVLERIGDFAHYEIYSLDQLSAHIEACQSRWCAICMMALSPPECNAKAIINRRSVCPHCQGEEGSRDLRCEKHGGPS